MNITKIAKPSNNYFLLQVTLTAMSL